MWETILLGLIQGLTEFLPVSSSGHLVLGQIWLGYQEHKLYVDVAVHLGTLLSIVTVYRHQLLRLIGHCMSFRNWRWQNDGAPLQTNVLVATLPAGVVGVLFKDQLEGLFSNVNVVTGCFIFTGCVLFLTRYFSKNLVDKTNEIFHFSILSAFLIGCAQAIAIAPGVSRSGMTIAVALFLGLRPGQAAYFSFLMAIPAILGGALLSFADVVWSQDIILEVVLAIGSAYIFGLLGLWIVLKVVGKGRLDFFSYYLWGLAALLFWGA